MFVAAFGAGALGVREFLEGLAGVGAFVVQDALQLGFDELVAVAFAALDLSLEGGEAFFGLGQPLFLAGLGEVHGFADFVAKLRNEFSLLGFVGFEAGGFAEAAHGFVQAAHFLHGFGIEGAAGIASGFGWVVMSPARLFSVGHGAVARAGAHLTFAAAGAFFGKGYTGHKQGQGGEDQCLFHVGLLWVGLVSTFPW